MTSPTTWKSLLVSIKLMLLITCRSVIGEVVAVGWTAVGLTDPAVGDAVEAALGAVVGDELVTGRAVAVSLLVGAVVGDTAAAKVVVGETDAPGMVVAWMPVVEVATTSGVSVGASGYGSHAAVPKSSVIRANKDRKNLGFMNFSSYLFYWRL